MKQIVLAVALLLGPEGYFSFGDLKADHILQGIEQKFSSQISLKLGPKAIIRENARFLLPLENRISVFQRLKAWKNRQFGFKNKALHIILPPTIDEQHVRWLWGMANLCRPKSGISVGIAVKKSREGISRIEASLTANSHEIGHLLGAFHNESVVSIMNPDAIRLSIESGPLAFLKQDWQGIFRCFSKNRL